jgi:hypothetical protein
MRRTGNNIANRAWHSVAQPFFQFRLFSLRVKGPAFSRQFDPASMLASDRLNAIGIRQHWDSRRESRTDYGQISDPPWEGLPLRHDGFFLTFAIRDQSYYALVARARRSMHVIKAIFGQVRRKR